MGAALHPVPPQEASAGSGSAGGGGVFDASGAAGQRGCVDSESGAQRGAVSLQAGSGCRAALAGRGRATEEAAATAGGDDAL